MSGSVAFVFVLASSSCLLLALGFESPGWKGLLFGALLIAGGLSWVATRCRRFAYQSGKWSRVERALRHDVRFGGAPPRLAALALAGVGDFASARRRLLRPPSSPLDEERELSLCTQVVIASFEGKLDQALSMCRQLVDLPFEPSSDQRKRRAARRAGVVAIARALSGTADEVDYEELRLTASLEPALFWPCRYGAAIACYARDESELARALLSEAPTWPRESVFSAIHPRIFASRALSPRVPDIAASA